MIYYVSTSETLNRDYKVRADSEAHAIEQVKLGEVFHYDEDLMNFVIDDCTPEDEEGVC